MSNMLSRRIYFMKDKRLQKLEFDRVATLEIANAPIDFPPTRRRTHLEIANLGLTSPRLMFLPNHLTIWKMRRFAALNPFSTWWHW
jgi:hypothetical protein